MGSFQWFSYTKPHFPLHNLQKYPSYKKSVDNLSFLNSVKLGILHKVSLTILNVRSAGTLGKLQSTNLQLFFLVNLQSVLINFNLQINNFLTKINDLNLQSTFFVVPPSQRTNCFAEAIWLVRFLGGSRFLIVHALRLLSTMKWFWGWILFFLLLRKACQN